MNRPELRDVVWLEPWEPVDESATNLEEELRRELPKGHQLSSLSVEVIARRTDCDDVLFGTSDPKHAYAVAHLTWAGRPESTPEWPQTTTYESLGDWVENCMKVDHAERMGAAEQRAAR